MLLCHFKLCTPATSFLLSARVMRVPAGEGFRLESAAVLRVTQVHGGGDICGAERQPLVLHERKNAAERTLVGLPLLLPGRQSLEICDQQRDGGSAGDIIGRKGRINARSKAASRLAWRS